jgi:hypothetical protein
LLIPRFIFEIGSKGRLGLFPYSLSVVKLLFVWRKCRKRGREREREEARREMWTLIVTEDVLYAIAYV